jgi:hypothetical protein
MVEKVNLWVILSLKFTFGILLFHKINPQHNSIRNNNQSLQGINAKCHLIVTKMCT